VLDDGGCHIPITSNILPFKKIEESLGEKPPTSTNKPLDDHFCVRDPQEQTAKHLTHVTSKQTEPMFPQGLNHHV